MSVFGQDFTQKGWHDPDRFDSEKQDAMIEMSDSKKKAKKREAAKALGGTNKHDDHRGSSPESDTRHDLERPYKKARRRKVSSLSSPSHSPASSLSSSSFVKERRKATATPTLSVCDSEEYDYYDCEGSLDHGEFEVPVRAAPEPMFPKKTKKSAMAGGQEQQEITNNKSKNVLPVIRGIAPQNRILPEACENEEGGQEDPFEPEERFAREESSESVDLYALASGSINEEGVPLTQEQQDQIRKDEEEEEKQQQQQQQQPEEVEEGEGNKDDDIVCYNAITDEASKLLGDDPDYIRDCILCELGIGNKNSQDLKPAIQQLSNLQNVCASKTCVARAVTMAHNYEQLVREPQNRIIQKMIDAKPGRKDAILKERPFYRELTEKQAWWHYVKPHIKSDENYMVNKMELYTTIQNSLKDECWMRNKRTGKREMNKEALDELRKWELMEVNLRKKTPSNPYFAGNPAATAIASAAISSNFPLQATISVNAKVSSKGLLDE